MRLWRGLAVRVLLASVGCGLVGLGAATIFTRMVLRELVIGAFAPLTIGGLRTNEQSLCEASPSTWSLALPADDVRAFAYDAASLTSWNPRAPPLDLSLYRALPSPPDAPMAADMRWPLRGGTFVLRIASSGPCGVVQVVARPRALRSRVVYVFLAGMIGVVSLAAALGFAFVVRPLTLRIERIRRAAERVGDAEGYASASPGGGDELGQLSKSLDRAHARIREDVLRLGRHLADVTHDLRTPLASLRLALEQAADASPSPEAQELLASALRDAVYLAALTDNLRMASRLREGWDPFAGGATVDLADTATRVVSRVGFFARRRGISLDVAVPDEPLPVRCDPVAAEQAIANVVENAVAYGDKGGHVALVLARKPEGFVLTVVDDGPGVAPAELPRLGERTFRSDEARQRDPRGSGLGLAITSEVCTRCGWTLRFDAEAPRGLRVTLAGPSA